MADRYLARIDGETRQVQALAVSAGAASAGRIICTGANGLLDPSLMPSGIGANAPIIEASEGMSGGVQVNIWADAGVAKIRLADNTNGRPADGYIEAAVAAGVGAPVHQLGGTNAGLSGLTPGARYWLGAAGAVADVPPDETDPANTGRISQYLGKAKSATELVTVSAGYVVL